MAQGNSISVNQAYQIGKLFVTDKHSRVNKLTDYDYFKYEIENTVAKPFKFICECKAAPNNTHLCNMRVAQNENCVLFSVDCIAYNFDPYDILFARDLDSQSLDVVKFCNLARMANDPLVRVSDNSKSLSIIGNLSKNNTIVNNIAKANHISTK